MTEQHVTLVLVVARLDTLSLSCLPNNDEETLLFLSLETTFKTKRNVTRLARSLVALG